MGVTFSVILETPVPPYGTLGGDHKVLARVRDRLDRLASKNGLTSLLAFESYAPEDMAGLMDDDQLTGQPPAEWFDAADGLAAVNALYDHLETNPGSIRDQAAVMEELSDLGDEVEAAARAGVRFRFAIVM